MYVYLSNSDHLLTSFPSFFVVIDGTMGSFFGKTIGSFLWDHFYDIIFMGTFVMGTFLWVRFLHGTIDGTLELSLTRLAEELFLTT